MWVHLSCNAKSIDLTGPSRIILFLRLNDILKKGQSEG